MALKVCSMARTMGNQWAARLRGGRTGGVQGPYQRVYHGPYRGLEPAPRPPTKAVRRDGMAGPDRAALRMVDADRARGP